LWIIRKDKTMKVETDLKAGGFIQDVVYQAEQAADNATNMFKQANQQAEGLTSGVVNTGKSFWNKLFG